MVNNYKELLCQSALMVVYVMCYILALAAPIIIIMLPMIIIKYLGGF